MFEHLSYIFESDNKDAFLRSVQNFDVIDLATGKTLLHLAAEKGACKISKILIDKFEDINLPDKDGNIPGHYAAKHGHVNILNLMIEHEVDINERTATSSKGLHAAVKSYPSDAMTCLIKEDEQKIIQYLLEAGYDVHQRDEYDDAPLFTAVSFLRPELISLFLNHGASMAVTNKKGDSILHLILKSTIYKLVLDPPFRDKIKILQLLLEQGMDVFAVNSEGKTFYDKFSNGWLNRITFFRSKEHHAHSFYEGFALLIKHGFFKKRLFQLEVGAFIHAMESKCRDLHRPLFKSLNVNSVIATKYYYKTNYYKFRNSSSSCDNGALWILLNLIASKGLPASYLSLQSFFDEFQQKHDLVFSGGQKEFFDKMKAKTSCFEKELIDTIMSDKHTLVFGFLKNSFSLYKNTKVKFYETPAWLDEPGNLIAQLLQRKDLFVNLIILNPRLEKHLRTDTIKYIMNKQQLVTIREAYWLVKNKCLNKLNNNKKPATKEELINQEIAAELVNLYEEIASGIENVNNDFSRLFSATKVELHPLLMLDDVPYANKTNGICWPLSHI